jgi:hypothetical protein
MRTVGFLGNCHTRSRFVLSKFQVVSMQAEEIYGWPDKA